MASVDRVETAEDNVTYHMWRTNIPPCGQSVKSNFFLIKNTNFHCKLTMTTHSADDLEILITKNYYSPAKAKITLMFEKGSPIVETIYSWIDDYKLTNIPKDFCSLFSPHQLQGNFVPTKKIVLPAEPRTLDTKNPCRLSQLIGGSNPAFDDSNIIITCKIEWIGFIHDIWSINLQKAFKDLYLQPKFSDLDIKIGNVKLPVHKIVLIDQSKIFSHDLQNKVVDIQCIEVNDVDMDTMKEVLWYLYSGETRFMENTDMTLSVLTAAIKYNILKLKDLCVSTLSTNLSTTNALQILKDTYELKINELHQKILLFMAKNKDKISTQKKFKDLLNTNSDLMYEFMMILWQSKS